MLFCLNYCRLNYINWSFERKHSVRKFNYFFCSLELLKTNSSIEQKTLNDKHIVQMSQKNATIEQNIVQRSKKNSSNELKNSSNEQNILQMSPKIVQMSKYSSNGQKK